MQAGFNAVIDCIKAFCGTDFTRDLGDRPTSRKSQAQVAF
jgi:hypothetical protein